MSFFRFLFTCFVLLLFTYLLLILESHHEPFNQKFSIHFMNENIYQNVSEETFEEQANYFLNALDSLQDINITLLEELIMDNNYVKKAEVYLSLEDTINIYIDFREPFVKVLENNKIYYSDSEGVVLPALKSFKKNLMVLSGDINSKEFGDLFSLVGDIYNDDVLGDLIGGIHYNEDDGYILSSKLCDIGINIGKQPLFDFNKLKQIEVFLIYMSEEMGCDYCDMINLEYNNQIICVN